MFVLLVDLCVAFNSNTCSQTRTWRYILLQTFSRPNAMFIMSSWTVCKYATKMVRVSDNYLGRDGCLHRAYFQPSAKSNLGPYLRLQRHERGPSLLLAGWFWHVMILLADTIKCEQSSDVLFRLDDANTELTHSTEVFWVIVPVYFHFVIFLYFYQGKLPPTIPLLLYRW